MKTVKEIMSEIYFRQQEKLNAFTEEQFVKTMLQAIKSGDFMRITNWDESAQAVTYVPYRERIRLQSKIDKAEEAIRMIYPNEETRPKILNDWINNLDKF